MPVSKEELVKDLETPEYQTLVKETLSKKEFVVQDKKENQDFLDRFKNDVIEKEMPARVKTIYDNIDKDVKTLLGVEREANEKTYDFVKRAINGKLTELQTSSNKIKELEDAIAGGQGGAAMKKRLEDEEANFKKLMREKDQKIRELEQQTQVTGRQADVKLLYGEIKKGFIKTLPAMFQRAEAAALSEAISNSVAKDGKLYMTNPDGSIRKDGAYNEITVEDFLRGEFKEVIEVKKTQGGGGSGPGNEPPNTDPSKITVETFAMKPDIKGRGALMDYMDSLGLKRGTPVYNAIYKKFGDPLTQQ